jgi:SOUL heme-binding protein
MFQSVMNFLWSLGFAIVAVFGINLGTKEPSYEVVEQLGEQIAIRHYPMRIVAETTIDTSKSADPERQAFGIIAGYIFGANKARQKIDMTAPVEVGAKSEKIEMTAPVELNSSQRVIVTRFFMPLNYTKEDLPEPTDSRVSLVELPPTTVAVLRFSGLSNPTVVSARTDELKSALKPTNWKASGPATVYFYNPPWTIPFLRRNEVVIPVAS